MAKLLYIFVLLIAFSSLSVSYSANNLNDDNKHEEELVAFFKNEDYPSPTKPESGIKVFTVSVTDPKVCQVRVDFVEFDLSPPSMHGNCDNQYIVIDDSTTLCGNNNGQNYVIHLDHPTTIDIILNIQTDENTYGYKFNLMVTQVDCYSTDEYMKNIRAPIGCDQFFIQSSGIIKSFNYDGVNMYSENQDYSICIKKSEYSCGIKYSNCNHCNGGDTRRSIGMSTIGRSYPPEYTPHQCGWELSTDSVEVGSYDSLCGEECLSARTEGGIYFGDWLTIGSAQVENWNDLSHPLSYKAYYCGSGLGIDPYGMAGDGMVSGDGVRDYSNGPFVLHFHTNGNNEATANTLEGPQINNLGFIIDYHVQSGHC